MSAAAQIAPPPGAVPLSAAPPPPPGAVAISGHPPDWDKYDQQMEDFKTEHPHIYGAMKSLLGNASLMPGEMAVGPIGAAVESATKAGGQSAGEFVSKVLQHPKTVAAMKEAAMDWLKSIPGVEGLIGTGKAAKTIKSVVDDVRGAQAVSDLPLSQPGAPVNGVPLRPPLAQPGVPPPSGPVVPVRPPLTEAAPIAPDVPAAPAPSGPVTPLRPPLAQAPPAAFMDTESTGIQIPQLVNNRARAAGNIAKGLQAQGITEADLNALDQSPAAYKSFWDHAGKLHRDGYTPSPDTVTAVKDLLKGTSGPAAPAAEEIPPYLARNPKALAAAQALRVSIGDLMNQTGK